jgi:WD40 repeat protein
MLDVESGDIAAWNRIYVGDVYDLTQDYVIENNGARADTLYSAEVLSRQAVREEDSTGRSPYSRSLSIDYDVSPYELFFNSRFESTLPNTNQILVLTWDADAVLDKNILAGSIDTDLQLWNLDTNELDLIIPGGIYGRYSPNHRYLVYLTPETNSSQLHLLDQTTGEIILTQTAFAEANDYSAEVKAYTTFSPNGRFLTFFNPAHELIIYDLESGEFLAPVTAVPATPLWSPDGSRFVYQDPAAGLSIFDTRSATAYPLAISGSDRLLDPQWSYDGAYLSVRVLQEEWWEWETAVLQIP